MEQELVKHVKNLDNMYYGHIMKDFVLAFQFAQKKNISSVPIHVKKRQGHDGYTASWNNTPIFPCGADCYRSLYNNCIRQGSVGKVL
jgi:hypothetical protein